MYGTVVGLSIGLTAGNFIWQAFTKREWGVATERSFFQAVALGAYMVVMAIH